MSEEKALEVLGIEEEQEPVVEPVKEEPKAKVSMEDWQSRQESKASQHGWKPFDEWVENGGDPDQWRSADAFNTYREMGNKLKQRDREFDDRLQGVNKIIAAQRMQLEAKRDEAIEAGDKNAVHKIERQMHELQATPVAKSDPLLEEWNERNPWVMEPGTAKTIFAQAQFNYAVNQGMSTAAALKHVDAAISKEFPIVHKSGKVPDSEKGSGGKGFNKGRQTVSVTMDDLTPIERATYELAGNLYKNDAEFLQAVADSRKGA
jgi:hypothetical protein